MDILQSIVDFGWALRLLERTGQSILQHPTPLAQMMRFPEQRFTVVCLANYGWFDPTTQCRRVADLCLADSFPPEEEQPVVAREEPAFVVLPDERLDQLAGLWFSASTDRFVEIRHRRGELRTGLGGASVRLKPTGANVFEAADSERSILVKFGMQEDGTETAHVTIQGKSPFELTRVEPFEPSPEELLEYAGSFYSRELDVLYEMRVEVGELIAVVRSIEYALNPRIRDVFMAQGRVEFFRNDQGSIAGFLLDGRRAHGIRFEREE